MIKIFTLFTLLFCATGNAALLDKIVAVIDDDVITLSQLKRVQNTIPARRNILPIVFNKNRMTIKELANITVNQMLIRKHLAEVGYNITDDQVESKVKETETRLGLTRNDLLQFLSSNGMSFDEYFELIRETIEINLFSVKVIRPLISVSEQEIKNEFYDRYSTKTSVSLKFDLVDFIINKSAVKRSQIKKLPAIMKKYQNTGNLPSNLNGITTNVIGAVTEAGLSPQIRNSLKKVQKDQFSKPVLLGDYYHVFYVKDRDLVESDLYHKKRNQINYELFEKKAGTVKDVWFQKQKDKHFVKLFI
ncbi:MAG: peptidylprolyl isomerase [Bacteriovoracaceae bacterium]